VDLEETLDKVVELAREELRIVRKRVIHSAGDRN
jgi:hypothetical protein